MARIGIDLDGVCYDFQGALREVLVNWGWEEEDLPLPAQHWYFFEDWGISVDAFKGVVTDATVHMGLFDYLPPINNADNVIRKLHNAGHEIHIITDREWGPSGESHRQTVSWLKGNSIPYDGLHFTANKAVVDTDFHIDDKPSNVQAMRERGVEAFLLDCPWNVNDGLLLPRVFSVAAFGEYVLLDWLNEEEIAHGDH